MATAPNFSITKQLDRASIGLFGASAQATEFKSGTEVLLVNAQTQENLLEYNFTNVYVTSAQLYGSSSDSRPVETDTFSFQSVKITYWLTTPTGSQMPYSVSYNFRSKPTSDGSTSTPATGASTDPQTTAGAHAASHVHASHKANAVDHGLANNKVSGTKLSKRHRIIAVGQRLESRHP